MFPRGLCDGKEGPAEFIEDTVSTEPTIKNTRFKEPQLSEHEHLASEALDPAVVFYNETCRMLLRQHVDAEVYILGIVISCVVWG